MGTGQLPDTVGCPWSMETADEELANKRLWIQVVAIGINYYLVFLYLLFA